MDGEAYALENDIFYQKMLETLELLVEMGEKYDFEYKGRRYRIAKSGSGEGVSLWEDGVEQSFADVAALAGHAVMGESTFRKELWSLPLGDLL